jgi:Basic region leucine zipper
VNKGLAASRSSHFASQATISLFDFTSFTTDHQQTWLSQPPSSAPASATHVQHNFNQDFSLFGAAQEIPTRHPQHLRARATSSIAPNFNLVQQPHPHSAHKGGSTQVQKLQSNGHTSTSYNNRSNSSPTLRNQHQQHQRPRPPIPLFTQGSEQVASPQSQTHLLHHQIHSTSSIPQGEYSISDLPSAQSLNRTVPANMSTTFDHMYLSGDDSFDPVDSMLGFGYSDQTFTAINGSASSQSPVTPQTVSPQELLNHTMAMSAPSSTAFPPLSTPGSTYFESPFMESSSLDTSPMVDGALDSTLDFKDFSMPLFPQDGSDLFVNTHTSFASAGTVSTNASTSSPMIHQKSSPGRPSTSNSGRGHARKHSSVSGISKPKTRRELEPIKITEEDSKEDAKRKKNTAAARKSRQKRQETMESYEAELQRLRGMLINLGHDPDAGSVLNNA